MILLSKVKKDLLLDSDELEHCQRVLKLNNIQYNKIENQIKTKLEESSYNNIFKL